MTVQIRDDSVGIGPCPRCGRPITRVEHEIAGRVRARPCGCEVRYVIDHGQVTVTEPPARQGAA